jgi:hypothetical protein
MGPKTNWNAFRKKIPLQVLCTATLVAFWVFRCWDIEWSADITALLRVIDYWRLSYHVPLHGIIASTGGYNFPGLPWIYLFSATFFSSEYIIIITTGIILNLVAAFYMIKMCKLLNLRHLTLILIIFFVNPQISRTPGIAWAFQILTPFLMATLWLTYLQIKRQHQITIIIILPILFYQINLHMSGIITCILFLLLLILFRARINLKFLSIGLLLAFLVATPYLIFEKNENYKSLISFTPGNGIYDKLALPIHQPSHNHSKLYMQLRPYAKRIQALPRQFCHWLTFNFRPTDNFLINIYNRLLLFFFLAGSALLSYRFYRNWDWNSKKFIWISDNELFLILVWIFVFIPFLLAGLLGVSKRCEFTIPAYPMQFLIAVWFLEQLARIIKYQPLLKNCVLLMYILFAVLPLVAIGVDLSKENTYRFSYRLQYRMAQEIDKNLKAMNCRSAQVSYDLLPEQEDVKFIALFHNINKIYYFGMDIDYLIENHFGWSLPSISGDGIRSNAILTVVMSPGLKRYPGKNILASIGPYRLLKTN